MPFIDDDFDVDVPSAPEVPDAPDIDVPNAPTTVAGAPDVPEAINTPDAPETPGGPSLPNMPEIPDVPKIGAAAPAAQLQQDIANLNDNSDLDTVKGSGPAATSSTRDVGGVSKTGALAQQTLNGGEQNMSPAPGAPKRYTAEDFTSGAKAASIEPRKGIIGSVLDWAHDNDKLASALFTGSMGAIAGAGKAALDKQTMERKSELEQANAKDLYAYKQQQSRDFAAAGVLQDGGVPFKTAGIINGALLRRPGGAPVFQVGTGKLV